MITTEDPAGPARRRGAARLRRLAVVVSVVGSSALFLALGASLQNLERFDADGLGWAFGRRGPALDTLMGALVAIGTEVGMTVVLTLFVAVMLWRRPAGWRWSTLLLVFSVAIGNLVNILIKQGYQRARPSLFPSPYHETSYSFPSGHAMAGTAFAVALAYILLGHVRHRWARALILLCAAIYVGAMAFARVYFSVHYPTDVFGGVVAGLGWVVLCIAGAEALRARRGVPQTDSQVAEPPRA